MFHQTATSTDGTDEVEANIMNAQEGKKMKDSVLANIHIWGFPYCGS